MRNDMITWMDIKNEPKVVTDMTTEHIINAVRWLVNDERFGQLNRFGITDKEWVQLFMEELMRRDK